MKEQDPPSLVAQFKADLINYGFTPLVTSPHDKQTKIVASSKVYSIEITITEKPREHNA